MLFFFYRSMNRFNIKWSSRDQSTQPWSQCGRTVVPKVKKNSETVAIFEGLRCCLPALIQAANADWCSTLFSAMLSTGFCYIVITSTSSFALVMSALFSFWYSMAAACCVFFQSKRQTMMFSATMPADVTSIASFAMRPEYATIDCVGEETSTHENVPQTWEVCSSFFLFGRMSLWVYLSCCTVCCKVTLTWFAGHLVRYLSYSTICGETSDSGVLYRASTL